MTDDSSGTTPEQTFRLMYRSRDRLAPEDRKTELGRLFSTARSNNKKRHVTGALLVSGDWFVQVLEGDEVEVRSLFGRIEQDPRHDAVELLDAVPEAERVFARWSMAKVAGDGEPDIPLIAHVDGISPAAGRGTTAEQDRLLDVMREAASHAPVD